MAALKTVEAVVVVFLTSIVGLIHCGCSLNDSSFIDNRDVSIKAISQDADSLLILVYCSDRWPFTTGDAVLLQRCVDGSWSPESAECNKSAAVLPGCDEPPPPQNAESMIRIPDASDYYALYYACPLYYHWLSGKEVDHMSQCVENIWSPVYDLCVLGCAVPKDCTELVNLGVIDDGVYYVVPSGKVNGDIILVWCHLDMLIDRDNTGWTTVLRHYKNNTDFEVPLSDYNDTIGDPLSARDGNSSYFIGMKHLLSLTENFWRGPRDLVFQFLFVDEEEQFYHITYDGITINSTTWQLESVGNYFGNASDALSLSLNESSSETPWWSSSSTQLTSPEIRWGKLTEKVVLEGVEINVRTKAFDAGRACPLINIADSRLNYTTVSVPLSRALGSVMMFECDEYFVDGSQTGPVSSEGMINCSTDFNTYKLFWDRSPVLPCIFNVPEQFHLGPDNISAYYVSNDTVPYGVVSAALECAYLNASLAIIQSGMVFDNIPINASAYTVHMRRGENVTEVDPPWTDEDLSCTYCEVMPGYDCLVIEGSEVDANMSFNEVNHTYAAESCEAGDMQYICMVPPFCPDNYARYRGHCYKLISAEVDFIGALNECNKEGSSLAYPENLDVLSFFEDMLRILITGDENADLDDRTKVKLGLHHNGFESDDGMSYDWTWHGVYSPDPDIMSMAEAGPMDYPWQLLSVPSNNGRQLKLNAASLYDNETSYAMCQHKGPQGCSLFDPRISAAANMHIFWDGNTSLLATAKYICHLGSFVNGTDQNNVTEQEAQCIGQLGDWYPPPIDCIHLKVCENSIPEAHEGMRNITWSNFMYYKSNIVFVCPETMGTREGQIEQTSTCVEENGYYWFEPQIFERCDVCLEEPFVQNATVEWDSSTEWTVSMATTFTCVANYSSHFQSNTGNIICTTNGWYHEDSCYEACTVDLPELGESMTMGNFMSDAVGSVITFTCDEGLYLQQVENYVDVTNSTYAKCSEEYIWELETSRPLTCVKLCVEEPPSGNYLIKSDWDGENRTIGVQITYSCLTSMFVFSDLSPTINVTCEEDAQWSRLDPDLFHCRIPAPGSPPLPPPGSTMVTEEDKFWVDSIVNYTCGETEMSPSRDKHYFAIIATVVSWTPPIPEDFRCLNYCRTPPPKAALEVKHNLTDDDVPFWGTVVRYYSFPGFTFIDYTTEVFVTCTEGVWLPDSVSAVQYMRPLPPEAPPHAVVTPSAPPYDMNITLNYSCLPGLASPLGVTYYLIKRTETAWDPMPLDFYCVSVCLDDPFGVWGNITYNYTHLVPWGETIEYKCNGQFHGGGTTRLNTCLEGGTWSLFHLPHCLPIDPNVPYVPLPTEPPVEFPDVNAEEQAYSDTADMHVASLNTAMEDVNGVPDNFGDTIGPFGFGKSVNLSSAQQQCLKKINYGPEGDCSMDPSLCTNGFSISIWEKAEFDEGHFYLVHKTDTENKRYIISTGGDEYGHPGLSLYHQGLALKAVVSTGDMFWTARAFGAVPPGVWTNLGIRWTQSFGLELYVNTRRVGQGKIGYTSTRQEPLNPSELIVGCHKTSSDPVYRDFNNAEFDELAIWTSALPDENLVYFLGGYNGEMKHLSPKEYEFMLKQTDMGDPRQAQRAFAVLGDISRDALKPVVIETTENGTSSSTASENAAGATVGVSDRADRLQPWVDVVESMTSINNVKDELPSSEMPAFAGIIHPISNLMNESAAEDWERYQKENIGSPFVMKRMEEYLMYTMRNIRFKNQELSFSHVEVADNIVASMDKLLIRDYEYNGKFVTPNLKKIPEVREGWGGISKAEIPNTLFKNHHCGTRPVNILSNLYKDLDHIAPMRLNPKTLNTGVRNALDSRVLSVNVIPDPPVYPGDSWCYPSQKQLQEDPLLLVLEHLNPQDVRPSRKLLFHENETLSDLAERHCVWWNARHGDLGAWDTEGCTKMESTVYFTKCTCSHFGAFSVMAEETETIEVPDEPFWLTIVRYTLYSISALCLILYIAVVGLSGDLKDQFHMTGLNLAAVLLAGSVFMIISDFESIRENRHACTIIGSFLHIFYLVAGGWIAVLGHAVFKSITSGIIQGLMNQYFLIPWGVTFMSFGLSYAAYLQDLGTDPRCFISWYNDVKHIFFFPLVICILVANFCAITIFFNLKTTALRGNPAMKEYMSFSIGGAVLVFYFTFTWIIGMFTYYQWESSSYIYPVFQIFNGLMGVVLLVCIGFLSSRFKMVLAGQAKRRKEMLMNMRKELSTKSDDKKKLHQRKDPKAKKVRDSQGEPPAASLRRPSNVDLEEERIGTWIPNEL